MSETKSYLNLLEESFPGMEKNLLRCEALGFHLESTSKPFLSESDGEFHSHVGLIEYLMLIEGQMYKACGLHAICTKKTHREQGLASALIKEALEWSKNRYEFVALFTEIPQFYEKFSFKPVQEYRFHLPCRHPKGSQSVIPLTAPNDNDLFLHLFRERSPLSNHLWVKDNGLISSYNSLFATYPTFWSLYYSRSINGIISFKLIDKTLHLYDIVASEIPSLEKILDHLPTAIDDIYFYFSPDRLTDEAIPEPYIYDHGHLMIHGNWTYDKPFMISPLSRC